MKFKRNGWKKVVTIGCLLVFLFAAYNLVEIAMEYYKNRKSLEDVQETFYASAAEKGSANLTDKASDLPIVQEEFKELLEQNEEVVGWIKIPGTEIDYPVLQADNNTDYLNKGFNKEYSIAGSIFMDYRNTIDSMKQNTVIYGHRMKDGSMFDDLIKYKDEDFFEEHKTFEIKTLYDTYEAEIFAVYITTTEFNYIETNFASDDEFAKYLTEIREQSMYQTDVEVDEDDQVLTLSTCDYLLDPNEGRMVVQAKLVKKN
ncbi:class B sortase [Ornithinibacillus halotolerans]|uniref:SrtB family sortase n=1 Tax=Ornithinibacillus halotolerans TaxID=1274357 RepID=A0A916W7N6_9BACI|nr:class B sortase [Ornithinibacillus halotolerans]GGA74429.1 SrtB family sortase [Ornithinibacillus halotolerans]